MECPLEVENNFTHRAQGSAFSPTRHRSTESQPVFETLFLNLDFKHRKVGRAPKLNGAIFSLFVVTSI